MTRIKTVRNIKCIGDIKSFDDLKRLVAMYDGKKDYKMLLMLIKTAKIQMTQEQKAQMENYVILVKKILADNEERREEKRKKQIDSDQTYTRIITIKKLISESADKAAVEKFYAKGRKEVDNMNREGATSKALTMKRQIDFLAGWALQAKDTLRAIEILNSSYQDIEHGTIMSALISYGIANCYMILSTKERSKYSDLLEKSLSDRDNEFLKLGKFGTKKAPHSRVMKDFVDLWRKKIVS